MALACIVLGVTLGNASAQETEPPTTDGYTPPAFIKDAAGATWLSWPTIPGWQYNVEAASTLEEQAFSALPGGYSFGTGSDHYYYVLAPSAPPATPPGGSQLPWKVYNIIGYVEDFTNAGSGTQATFH